MASPPAPDYSASLYHALPKVDLHRHLEGSLRLETLLEVGRMHNLDLPATRKLRELVQVGNQENFSFQNFLSKFETLRLFYRSPEIIQRVAREAVIDAAADNVRYLELRFTPVALSRAQSFKLGEVIDWVIESVQSTGEEQGIQTGLIVSVNRHESLTEAEHVFSMAADRIDKGLLGVDLAGNEVENSALPFIGIFREAREAGMKVTIHAGEWSKPTNVEEAILQLGAQRIGHGIRVLDDPRVTTLARERGTAFEVCITSNYQTGAVPAHHIHPFPRMLSHGLNASLHTDDPKISQITLSGEYRRAHEELGISLDLLKERILSAANASFLPETKRQHLVEALAAELASFSS